MKVAVITRHAPSNYGSVLQTIAMQTVLETLGYSCQTIDYIRCDEEPQRLEKTLVRQKRQWNRNSLTRKIYLILRQPECIYAGKKFEAMRTERLHLTCRYSSAQELQTNPPEADVYITGSDQVWGPTSDGSYDSAYFLGFTGDDKKRISYAASLGRTTLNEETKQLFQKYLPRYDHVSVREDSAVELLNQLGISAQQVLDPTLLLMRQQWEEMLEPIPDGKYVLVYQIHNNPALSRYAVKAAKKMGLPLIRVSPSLHQITRGGKFVFCPTLGQFLSYVKNAECLFTDSFHGTAFALTFNTPFVEVLPNNNTGTRNMSILKLTGLSHRILQDENDTALASQPVDFTEANAILTKKRQESLEILKQMIEN